MCKVRVEVIFDTIDPGLNHLAKFFSYLFKSDISSERYVFLIIMKEII